MAGAIPFLAQLSQPLDNSDPAEPLIVGPEGLLRRSGKKQPFVIELLNDSLADRVATYLTEAQTDTPDPDMIRVSDQRSADFEPNYLNSTVTRAPEPNDPDLMRSSSRRELATSFTNGRTDQPDPDWIRGH